MLVTLALVVFIAAIVVLFSQEMITAVKKVFAIKGLSLVLPLALASFLYCYLYHWCLWGAMYYQEVLMKLVVLVHSLIPWQKGSVPLALIFVITLVSVLPVWLLRWYSSKKNYRPYLYPYMTSTLIWLSAAFLLINQAV